MPTVSEIKTVAYQVREQEVSESYGRCYPASRALVKRLSEVFDVGRDELEVEGVWMGERHYVVAFPASSVDDSSAKGRIIIDITLDQYCDENVAAGRLDVSLGPRESISSVNVYESWDDSPYRRR